MISSPFDRLDYPSLRQSAYLNQASLGLIGQPAVTAMHTFIDNVARHGNLYMSDSDEVAYCETLRERAARLFHCDSGRVAIVASASEILGQPGTFSGNQNCHFRAIMRLLPPEEGIRTMSPTCALVSLSLALRSTMSLPGIFSPVRWDGHIFADGGLMDNLPVDVAQSMGAELTLAVHLETAKIEGTTEMSSLGVLGRSISVVIAANELRSIEKADIVISVPLQHFDSMEYSRADELINAGYQAAQAKAALLKTLSVDESTWQAYLAQRSSRRLATPTPQFVEVAGASSQSANALEKDLKYVW